MTLMVPFWNSYASKRTYLKKLALVGSHGTVRDSGVDGSSGFGYCMKDRTLNAAEVADANWVAYPCGSAAGDQYFKTIDNESVDGIAIMQSGSATSTNSSWIGYRLNVPSNQAAGTYTTTIVYVVTTNYYAG